MRRPTTVLLTLATAVVAVGLLATACGSDGATSSGSSGTTGTTGTTAPAGGDPIVGPWTLTGYTADGGPTAAAAVPAAVTLSDDGSFAGTTGCNQLSGTWTSGPDGAFTISPGPMTLRACADPAGQAQEAALTTGLPQVTGAAVAGTTLTMTDSSGTALFTWTRGSETLVGSYTVTGINDGQDAVVGSAAAESATITFAGDGTVSGTTGCNSFSGSYTVDGSSLEIDGDVAATMMACEDAAQQVEQQFLTALGEVATWERSGPTVTLRDAAGATQLTLVASS